MEKRMYKEPVFEMISIEIEDVICTSAGDNDSSWDGTAADATNID